MKGRENPIQTEANPREMEEKPSKAKKTLIIYKFIEVEETVEDIEEFKDFAFGKVSNNKYHVVRNGPFLFMTFYVVNLRDASSREIHLHYYKTVYLVIVLVFV